MQTLSGGGQQRLAFARLLIEERDIIVMDEATAALDIDSEFRLLAKLFERLPDETVLSGGHRPTSSRSVQRSNSNNYSGRAV